MATNSSRGKECGCSPFQTAPAEFIHRRRSLNGRTSDQKRSPCRCQKPATGHHPAGAFDAAAWLADWSDHGGIVATVSDRLWIGRAPCLDRNAVQRLDSLRGGIMHPEAATAPMRALRGNLAETEA